MFPTHLGRQARLKLALLPFLAIAAPHPAPAAAPRPADIAPPVALVQVPLATAADRARFETLGLDLIAMRAGSWARVLAWPGDLEALQRAGFAPVIVEADYGRSLARGREFVPKAGPGQTTALPPFGSGSMGGFYTLAEVNAWLDTTAAHDPNGIISNVVTVGTSRQGRAIRALRIAKESAGDHTRPRVLYTGLTHAREPGGMQNVLYYMDKLITGYGIDPNLTYLVDQREMWFVPCVNPDGYMINENTYIGTASFGMWRKNARDNNNDGQINGSDGVDINRNFGYQWGFNNSGSSPTGSNETYRGPSAFSEPETQALRAFCVTHGFRTAQNFHTYFETTLYPWGYNSTINPDGAYYIRLVDDMMRDGHYIYGFPNEILYPVNGDANDWMYGEQVQKPKIIAVTSEAGDQNDGFWPAAGRILPIAHQNYRSNIVLGYAAGTYVHADPVQTTQIVSTDGFLHPNGSAEVSITLRNDGVDASNGAVSLTVTTSTPGITITDGSSTYAAIASGTAAAPAGGDRIGLTAAASVPAGTIVSLRLEIHDAGTYALRDTTRITVGQPLVVFSDNASGGLANWSAVGGWGIQTVASNPLFSDSPFGNYATGVDARLTLNAPLDLSGGLKAFLEFRTQWFIEQGYDFARVEVSTNGGTTWTALAGQQTRLGHGTSGAYSGGTQPTGEPGYDGSKRFLAPEVVDLSAYVGLSNVRLRFQLTSDGGVELDGWWIDDIRVLVYPDDRTDVGSADRPGDAVEFVLTGANPFRTSTALRATFARPTVFRAAVYGVDGRMIRLLAAGIAAAGSRDITWDGRDGNGQAVAAGTYIVRLDSDAGSLSRRVVHVH